MEVKKAAHLTTILEQRRIKFSCMSLGTQSRHPSFFSIEAYAIDLMQSISNRKSETWLIDQTLTTQVRLFRWDDCTLEFQGVGLTWVNTLVTLVTLLSFTPTHLAGA